MTSTWNDLASNERWRGVVSFIRNWVGPFDSDMGMPAEELQATLSVNHLSLPASVREWYLLAANWKQGGLGVWIRPQELTATDGVVWLLTDMYGITHWGVRVDDLGKEDPPVVTMEKNNEVVSPRFSEFVALMTVSEVVFDYAVEAPVELNRDAVHADKMRPVSACFGDLYADGKLESATVVMFAYPNDGPVYGKARTAEGRRFLQSFAKKAS
jgi:hypothetical protein